MEKDFGLKFRSVNLSELRDETIYKKIKDDTQREYILGIFLYNIVYLYLTYYWYNNICKDDDYSKPDFAQVTGITPDKEKYFFTEMGEFKKFIESDSNKEILSMLKEHKITKIICNREYIVSRTFYEIFNLYDDNFNSRIILENLCEIKINPEQFYSVVLHFFDKTDYLQNIFEPLYNMRSIIIKNYYFTNNNPTSNRDDKLPLRNSEGIDYELNKDLANHFTYNFNERFKKDVINKNWSDGYDFYWKPTEVDENMEKKDKSKCVRYLVEILNPNNDTVISMTVTKNPAISNKQIHFYIKRNITTQIKSFVMRSEQFKNISLKIHSFAAWLFNADYIYSNLMHSMKKIFEAKGINIEDGYEDEIKYFASFCIRNVGHKINVDDKFKHMWMNNGKEKELSLNEFVKIYQVEPQSSSHNKYLKYKAKYLNLKKFIFQNHQNYHHYLNDN